jgi:hypothetical protein
MAKINLFLVALYALFYANYTKGDFCPEPYSQCNFGKDGMINVHIVPHTHDDVG